MQLVKKVFSSMLILIGILLMSALFCFAIMMVFHVSIFGYTYASKDDIGIDYRYDQTNADKKINTIQLDTERASIVIMEASEEAQKDVSVLIKQDFQGIVKSDVKEFSYNVPLNEEETEFSKKPVLQDGVLKIVTKEPSGLMFRNKTYISIVIPKNMVLDGFNVVTGADYVDVGNSHNIQIKDLSLVCTNKSIFSKISLSDYLTITGKLHLETNYGRITINSIIKNDVNIKSKRGSIIFNNDVQGDVVIEGENPYVEFGKITEKAVNTIENSKAEEYTRQKNMEKSQSKINDLQNKIDSENKKAENALKDIKKVNITGSLTIINCSNGNVKVGGTVYGFVYLNAPNIQFWANNVENGFTCESGSNNIRIFGSLCKTHAANTCTIKNGEGHLFINNCYPNVDIYASKNGVNIKNAFNNVKIENKDYGTIVNFAEGVLGKTLDVKQEKGSITATNLTGPTKLTADSNSIYAEFIKVQGENEIKAKFNIKTIVKDGQEYTFTVKSNTKKSKLDVRLGSVKYSGWIAESSTAEIKNNINNSSTGDLANSLLLWTTDGGKIQATTY